VIKFRKSLIVGDGDDCGVGDFGAVGCEISSGYVFIGVIGGVDGIGVGHTLGFFMKKNMFCKFHS
jgi:hypothetical protein